MAALVSTLCGILVAGLALPVVATLGLGAKNAADEFMELPTELDVTPLATRSRVLASDGSLLASFYAVDRIATRPELVPSAMKKAVIAIEDSRFYEHHGIDVKGTLRAAVTNAKSGQVTQGGSTLTQQYVKNVLIENATGDPEAQKAAREESADRKLREARLAVALEKKMTKDEILHGYLEIAYFGNGVYGIGSAASFYFKKPVQKLSVIESAELAGMVQNPNAFNPASTDPDVRRAVLDRRNTVLGRMLDLGFLSQAQHDAAVKAPLPRVKTQKVPRDCDAAGVTAPFFCDYVLKELTQTDVGAALGGSVGERFDVLFRGGLTIKTSLDPVVQKDAQTALDERLPRTDPSGAAAATNVVQPGTGLIRAMAVNRTYGRNKKTGQENVNLAIGGTLGVQPGSTFKIFTLAAALQEGIPVGTKIPSPDVYTSKVFKNGPFEPYKPKNSGDGHGGTFDLRSGMEHSVNTFFIQLAERLAEPSGRLEKPFALAESLGVAQKTSILGTKPLDRFPSGVLGASTVSPLAMAGAYAAFDAHGKFCPPRAVVSITRGGAQLTVPANECRQVVDPGVADTVTDIMRGVITKGTAARNGSIGRPAAGKTGTTNESRAAWFIGYTPQLTTAVWVGLPNANGEPQPMRRVTINGRYYPQMYGGDLPTQIWAQTMRTAHEDLGLPVEQFSQADADVLDGKDVTVPDTEGVSYEEAVRRLEEAGLSPTRGRRVSSSLPEGVVAYTYPAAGDTAGFGETTYVYTSAGRVFTTPTRTPTPTTTTAAPPPPPPTTTAPAKPTKPGKPGKPGR
jgi:membrane peptidoglycan carboxypeptidase